PSLFEVVPLLSKNGDLGAKIKESLSLGKTIAEKELQLEDKTVEVIITPVLGPIENYEEPQRRAIMGVTVLLHDITLEKSLENLKEEFTNAVVHELRSPLTAIKSASEVLGDTPDMPASVKRLATIIDQQSQRLLGEIASLLDAAKLEAGHLTVWQKPTDIVSVINDSLQLFQAEAEKKYVSIDTSIEKDLPQAFIDTNRIGQVLNNLLSNSLKFTHGHGHILVKITSLKNPQLPSSPTNPGILVSVSDDGVGIPPDKQKALFNKFSQIHNASFGQELAQGTGLGLYIARGIVQSHGGTMTLQSVEGRGTTVFFTLPVAPIETKQALPPQFQEVLARYTPPMVN
ncbi:MAG TPA: HAMP domain-containing sensor histidine kinase, partial [Candidatus Saccharimonadales bacterium]|nr:HAMP domain-containing sensor histidine kinase [Candidatus Saccharimonadales bacterium]